MNKFVMDIFLFSGHINILMILGNYVNDRVKEICSRNHENQSLAIYTLV